MEIIITPDPASASKEAARFLAALLRKKPHAVLGLATGGTPLPLYRELIRMHRQEGLDFSRCTTFNLDEYVGLGAEHPASYRRFMQEHLFASLNIPPDHIRIPDGLAADIPAHCAAYEQAIVEAGGIDAQILGIGGDGHIGFNEPTSSLGSRTRLKTLTVRTREDNARFFASPGEVPHHVITMGIGTILDARSLVLLAFGAAKAEAVAAMVEGPITAMVPASALQMHPVVKVLLDEPAASKLKRRGYYRDVFAHKPEWQRW
ncbi:MAG: glucosamine-6-phosphate deaminase [Verrucomicrobiota bacterium]